MRTRPRPAAVARLLPDRRAVLGLAAALLTLAAAPAPAPAPAWTLVLQQVGVSGAPVGNAVRLTCPQAGCEASFPLAIGRETHQFHIQVAFVATGAYLTIVQRSPSIRAVTEFSAGHKGPIFAPLRSRTIDTKLVQLVVAGADDPGNPVLASGPVFNTKMRPDAYLRVVFQKPGPETK